MNTLVVLFACLISLGAAQTIYTDFVLFSALLPTQQDEIAFDNYSSIVNPPYLPDDALNYGNGFLTYNFSQSGFSYNNTALGSPPQNNLLPCFIDIVNGPFFEEAHTPGQAGVLIYNFYDTLPTLLGALICSTDNGCNYVQDTISVSINDVYNTTISATPNGCPFWGIEFPAGIHTLTLSGINAVGFPAVTNLTLALSTHSGGFQDPHFVGLQGEKWDFGGVAGNWYNILSSPKLQFNALFSRTCKGSKGTVMTSVAINTNGHKFFINHTLEASLDGAPITDLITWNLPLYVGRGGSDGVIVRPWDNFFRIETDELIIVSSVYFVNFTDQSPGGVFYGEECVASYFNLYVSDISHGTFMHGIIGQTAQHDHPSNLIIKDQSDMEGTGNDYVVSGPWGTSFKFNQYTGPV